MSRSAACLVFLAAALVSTAALAVPRAYVASYGNDANTATNCGPTTPCRTFASAMSVADTGGQVVVLDSAGYGSVTITKSISLIAPDGIYAGLTVASGGNAVTIATAGVDVVLKGLTITGQGSGYGISMWNGNSLHVEKTTIANFTSGTGLSAQAAAKVNIIDSVIRDNNSGIYAGNGATMNITGSRILNQGLDGIVIQTATTATGATTAVTVTDTVVSGAQFCLDNWEIAGNTGTMYATNVTASNCSSRAFLNEPDGAGSMTLASCTATESNTGFKSVTGTMTVSGSSAGGNTTGFNSSGGTLTVSGSTASNNTMGFSRTAGTFVSAGNNWVYGNTTNTSGTITSAALQ
jgi:hypothetical protein